MPSAVLAVHPADTPGEAVYLLCSLGVAGLALVIPYSPLAAVLGLDGPQPMVVAALVAVTAPYVAATEVAKGRFYR